MDPVTTALLVVVVTCAVGYLISRKSHTHGKRLPPGPPGWPLLGNAMSIPARDYLYFEELKKKYGDLTLVKLGTFDFLYLNTAHAMREALVNQADTFSGRLRSAYVDDLTGSSGIIFRDGTDWSEHRRFTLKALRDLGLGRSETEEKALAEFEYLLKRLPIGGPVEVFPLFVGCMNNVISQLAFGQRCGTDDPDFEEFQSRMNELFDRGQSVTAMLPVLFPSLMKVPLVYSLLEKHSGMRDFINFAHSYIRRKIDEHESELSDLEQEPRDVCDALLIERRKRESEIPAKSHTFTYQQLVRDLLELFVAGTDTTAVTLSWAIFLMAVNKDVQKKVQEEINSVIGLDGPVSMKTRIEMPYVNATIDEILRVSTMVPTGLPHRCREDTELLGYFIPKDIVVMTNLYSIHRDPSAWKYPYKFYPEHFLSDDGIYKPSDNLMAFSLGRRDCIGQGLAKMQLFIFFVSTFQRFDVRLEDEQVDPEVIMAGIGGAQRRLLPHNVIFSFRSTD